MSVVLALLVRPPQKRAYDGQRLVKGFQELNKERCYAFYPTFFCRLSPFTPDTFKFLNDRVRRRR